MDDSWGKISMVSTFDTNEGLSKLSLILETPNLFGFGKQKIFSEKLTPIKAEIRKNLPAKIQTKDRFRELCFGKI